MKPTEADQAALDHLKPVDADFLAQNGDATTTDEQTAWFTATADEFRGQGATHFRYSRHPTIPNLCLVEGWKVRPANEGDPRWLLTSA